MLRGMREVLLLGDLLRVDDVEDAAVCRVLLRGHQDCVHDVVDVNQRYRAAAAAGGGPATGEREHAAGRAPCLAWAADPSSTDAHTLGRASGRERGCQYVGI